VRPPGPSLNTMSDPVISAMTALGIDHELVACDPDLADTTEFCATYGFSLEESANAIVVVGKSDPPRHLMGLTLAQYRLDVNRTIRKRLGVRKASFASAQQTIELTGMEIGGVTPFGTTEPLPLWIDARVMEGSRIIIGGGSRDRKFLVDPKSLLALPGAEVVDGLAMAAS